MPKCNFRSLIRKWAPWVAARSPQCFCTPCNMATVYGINNRFSQQYNVVFYVYADLCSLLAATSQFSILIGQNMQLTGCHNGNEMRNAKCADTQISIEWPYCSFSYCDMASSTLESLLAHG